MLNNKQKKNNKQFIVVDNVWIEKWKEIVKYELIKNKCQKYIKKQSPILKKEISDNLKQNNSLEKFNELLIQKNSSKIKKGNKFGGFKEESNFFPIEKQQINYFNKEFDNINGMGDYFNGKLFLHNTFFDKEEAQKILVFEKNEKNEFNQAIITLKPKEKVKDKLKEIEEKFKNKTIEEMLNDKEFKETITNITLKENSPYKINNLEINTNIKTDKKENQNNNILTEDKKKEEDKTRKTEEEKKSTEEEQKKLKRDEEKRKLEKEKTKIEEKKNTTNKGMKEDRENKLKVDEKIQKKEDEKQKNLEEGKKIEGEKKSKEEEKKSKEEERKRKEEEEKKSKEEERKKKEEEERKRKEEEERKKKEEEERKRKEEEERKRKEEEERKKKEEEERKRKEEEKKKKEEEEKKKKALDEERKRIEEEEKKRKEEKEKKRKEEEEEKKKKEEEEKKKKEEEEQNKKLEEDKKKLEEKERIKKEQEKLEKNENKIIQNDLVNKHENNVINGIKEIYEFNKKIKNELSKSDNTFLLKCSVINKKWYENFLELSNYKFFEDKMDKLKFSHIEETKEIQNTIKTDIKTINFNELETLYQNNKNDNFSKPLDEIENLAFVSEKFVHQINEFVKDKNTNEKKESKNNFFEPNSKEIIIKNEQAILKINDQKFVCFNPKKGDINNQIEKQKINFPKGKNFDLFKKIKEDNKKQGIKDIVYNQIYESKPVLKNKPIINQKINNFIDNDKDKKKDKKDINNKEKPIKAPRIEIKNVSSLGLDNVGATCYMNATLQCLAHIKRVSDHILNYKKNGKFKDDKNKKYRLSSAYADVLEGIWCPKNNERSYAPNKFKDILGEMNPLFAPTAANDAKDLLIYIIEQMHNELNESTEKNLSLIMPDNMDPTNQQQVLECFGYEFMKKYKSVFSHYFYGSTMSMTQCFGCSVIKYSFQCFSFIIFPLLEAKRFCVQSGRVHPLFINTYTLNIEDCFIYNQKLEFFAESNQMYCNNCKQLRNSSMGTRIYTAPLVFILILNRGKGNKDFEEKFIFWETIDLTRYVEYQFPDNKYFLAGVISHLGDSGPSGHFIAFCRMSETSPWFRYNDSIVTQSNFNEINTQGIPYILFYQKIKMDE